MLQVDHFWAVVPAGGAGTRLWPLSRSSSPKFLLDLTGSGRTLIQQTVERLAPLAGERLLVVTGSAHRDAVAGQLPSLDVDSLVVEPSPRDSMAAIGLAAALVERRDPDAVIGSFAADHVIGDDAGFHDAVGRAVAAATDGWLVTIGITPTSPATGFGYVEVGAPLAGHDGVHRASGFVEKPDAARASEYVAGGRHRWNAGMFLARPGVLLDLLAEQDDGFAARLRSIAADPARLTELWDDLPTIAIDHAVAEPAAAAGRVAVLPADLAWDDLGDLDSLARVLGAEGTLRVLGEESSVAVAGATGLVVPASGRVVAVVGLDDVVVVDTPDALLVTSRAQAQRVREIVAGLEEAGHDELR
ncbi:mannose-1-phosphate guanylyltransferase [Nocardioides sp.]|uniref:mannose-1-phosphate guanylyltransferase n=1 Tax=Nocardioides sp. TaxID=35761 RepID=UPI002ED3D702